MKILVINCGSSSIKYKLYEMDDRSVLAAGGIERVGLPGAFLKTTVNGEKVTLDFDCPTHTEGIKKMFDTLLDPQSTRSPRPDTALWPADASQRAVW